MTDIGTSIARLQSLREMIAETRQAAGMLELEIIKEMEANDQVAFEDGRFKARIPVKREYNPHEFVKLAEIIPPAIFNEVYSPAHEITKEVPASVNGTKAKKLWDMGYKKELESTLLPPKRSLKIEKRKNEQAM